MVKAETPRLPGSAGKTRAAQRGWLRWSTTRRREAPSHPTWLGNDRSDLPGGEPACALGVRGLVAHAQKRRRDGGERRRTEASVRAEPPAPNWKLGRCPESHSASSGFPLSSRGRARAIIGVPQGPPGAVHRARPTRRWCRRSGQPRSARQPGPRHTGKPLGGGGVWGERVRCAHMEGIEVSAARGAPIQLGVSCFSGRGCAIESGEPGGKVKPDTTLGLLAGPPETPERLQGGGALSGGAPPPEAIDLMGMNVAPPEAGDGEGGDASTPWFSGQDARGPARLASTVDEAPTGGAFAPPPGWATTETISPGASLRARWASGSSSLTHRSADATEANVVARRPVSARNRRRRTGSSRVAPTATAHRAAFRHRLGGVLVPSLGFRNGHLGPCIGPAQQAAGADGPGSLAPLGSPARGTPADRWAAEAFGGESAMCTPGRDRGRCCTRSADRTRGLLLQREGLRDRERGTGWQGEAGHDVGAACGAARNT